MLSIDDLRTLGFALLTSAVAGCGSSDRGYIATESEAKRVCAVALQSNLADFKIAAEGFELRAIKREESPDRWRCEYRRGREQWSVILDPSSGRAELTTFEPKE